jgi:hypothetical protein
MKNFIRIKKINPLKIGAVVAILYSTISFIIIIPSFLNGIAKLGYSSFLILLPILLYTVIVFVIGIILGILYNLYSKWVGGIEIEIENIDNFTE